MQLYADEDFPLPAVEELRRLGHDVLTAQEDGRRATPDPAVLAQAHALGRTMVTYSRRHYERLHGGVRHTAGSFPRARMWTTRPSRPVFTRP